MSFSPQQLSLQIYCHCRENASLTPDFKLRNLMYFTVEALSLKEVDKFHKLQTEFDLNLKSQMLTI